MPSEINSDYPHNAQPPEITPSDQYQEGYDNYMEIQQLKKAKQEAEKKVFIDALTGCYNQDAWIDFQKHSDIGRGDKATIIIIDLNGLKKINDQEGHSVGDKYIKDTVSYLQEVFSRAGDQVYRIGGDELAIACNFVLPEKRDEFNLYLSSHFNYDLLNQKGLDFAFGVAHSDTQQDISIKDTINRADIAMYQNKKEIKDAHPEKYSRQS